jgi:hypothetical protein
MSFGYHYHRLKRKSIKWKPVSPSADTTMESNPSSRIPSPTLAIDPPHAPTSYEPRVLSTTRFASTEQLTRESFLVLAEIFNAMVEPCKTYSNCEHLNGQDCGGFLACIVGATMAPISRMSVYSVLCKMGLITKEEMVKSCNAYEDVFNLKLTDAGRTYVRACEKSPTFQIRGGFLAMMNRIKPVPTECWKQSFPLVAAFMATNEKKDFYTTVSVAITPELMSMLMTKPTPA